MLSDRVKRQVDRLLDQAEEAIALRQWEELRAICEVVLNLDSENTDATRYLALADKSLATEVKSGSSDIVEPPEDPAPEANTPPPPPVVPQDAEPEDRTDTNPSDSRMSGQRVRDLAVANSKLALEQTVTSDPKIPLELLGYKSPRRRANWTMGLIMAGIVSTVMLIIVTNSQNELINRFLSGEQVSNDQMDRNDIFVGLVSLTFLAVFAASAVAFLMWIHRASSNLEPLDAQAQRFSPRWAVGWWFIPIMVWWRPYQVVQEIWKGSDPYYVGERAKNWEEAPRGVWLVWWWAMWLISTFSLTSSSTVRGGSPQLFWYTEIVGEEMKAANESGYFSEYIFIAVSVLALFVVKVISNRQERKFNAIYAINLDTLRNIGPYTEQESA